MRATYRVPYSLRVYRGWLIVLVVFLSSALSIGPAYAFGLFIEPLQSSFGWQRTAIGASLSFAAVGSLTSPLVGRLMDRYGARPIMTMSLVIMGTSFLLRPAMSELWHWYLLSFFQYLAFAGSTGLPAGRLVAIWFHRTRDRVMGLALMGNNFGGLTVPLITGFLLATGNWQAAFVVLAALVFLVAALVLVVVRDRPDDSLGQPDEQAAALRPSGPVLSGWTVGRALRSRKFYLISLATMLASFTYSAVLPQIGDHLASEGMSPAVVPFAISLLAGFGMAGKVSFGYLSERFTARRAMMLSLGGQIVFIFMIVGLASPPAVWVSVALFGFFMGGYGTLITLIVQENFGVRHFGIISGLVGMASIVPFFAGPLVAGASFDLTESYGPAFIAVTGLFAAAFALLTQVSQPDPEFRTVSAR